MATGLRDVTLDDKYTALRGRVFATGIQALVRLPLDQRRRDAAAGLDTAGYVTGYRGSPLGGYDQQLERAGRFLAEHGIVHQPAVNEDLAATACQGTQQVALAPEATREGVFAIWYGKGPGVDRSGDAIRHGNLFGTADKGGVLLLLGDDHICESSTTAHQSEFAMVDAMVPVLNPSGVQEILDYGLLGIAMSRFSGAWVALKCMHDTVESTASIEVGPERQAIVVPEDGFGPRAVHVPAETPWPAVALELERRAHLPKRRAAYAFARANRIDRLVAGGGEADWLGIVTCGKSWQDVVAALDELGLDETRLRTLGVRVYKVGMTWPLEPEGLKEALAGLELAMVVEEKRALVEVQIKEILFDAERRPRVIGKADEHGQTLFPSWGQLEPLMIASALAQRIVARTRDPELGAMLEGLRQRRARLPGQQGLARLPWFCPGCPHNSSTRVPDGSKAVGGIGCHFMVTWMGRSTAGFTQMGGEGASWLGMAPFTGRGHVFQNVGDGTFYHSGSLAVRAAVAAKADITFKILYNDAVAMTGGQKMETANLSVPQITRLLEAEGVGTTMVVTDEPEKYPADAGFAAGTRVRHRDDLDAVQRELREIPGVTALVYDQTCAAEKRRRRKRGAYPDPDERVIINELVCEGCGDCGVQSSCVAIQPVETEWGRKRRIDQSGCNKDFSCLKGFCPSFVSVKGGRLARQARGTGEVPFPVLPEPGLPSLEKPYGIVVTGIGGTGVVTIAAILGMAAHLEGKACLALDMTGLAQKGGAVLSHLKLARTAEETGSPRIAAGGASLLLGCDVLVAAGAVALPTIGRGRTRVVASTEEVMSGQFTRDPDLVFPGRHLVQTLKDAAGADAVTMVDAARLARALLGDAIATNLFMVGFAWQKGLIPLGHEAIEQAIAVNGVAVELNERAFLWGRRMAHDPAAVERIAGREVTTPPVATLDEVIQRRVAFLASYQDTAYAERYRARVRTVREAETRQVLGREDLTTAVARSLFKLMAYKDEYEVARLYTDGAFEAQLGREFASWDRLEVHLAPPIMARRDPVSGHLRKRRFGSWMLKAFGLLAKAKRLRGTPFDPFGRTAERRMERRLIADYEALLDELAAGLTADNHGLAVELASLPQRIRGFGHVKEANVQAAEQTRGELLAAFRSDAIKLAAAE